MKALSIRQPWAWAIMHAGKDTENRTWPTRFRGRFFVHASKKVDTEAITYLRNAMGLNVPDVKDLPGGCVVGTVELVDCVDTSDSDWFGGPWGFVLRDPKAFPYPVPCKGRLGFFEPPQMDSDGGTE